jgi:pimeloyl-ACP methyl ester carboxylesterase
MSFRQAFPVETVEQKARRQGLGISDALTHREVWRLDASINVEIYPVSHSAPNILFLAGIGTYVELYAELAVALNQQGFNVIAVDPPGHGYSAGNRGRYTVEQFQHHLSHVLNALESRFTGPWSVYGYSIGAVTAVALAELDQRIQSVLCTTLLLGQEPPDMMYALGWSWTRFSALWFPNMRLPLKSFIDFESLLGDHPAGPYINDDPLIIFDYPLATLASLFTHQAGIADSVFPFTLINLQGDHDEVLSKEYALRVANRIKQPMHLEFIEGAGHMMPWDDPENLAHRIALLLGK